MSSPRITYAHHPSTSHEAEIATLVAVYSFVLRSSKAKKKAGGSDAGGDDARKVKDACTAEEKYTRT